MSEGAGSEPAGLAAFPVAGYARARPLDRGLWPASSAKFPIDKDLPMASETIRNPQTDQLLSPETSALIIIDYQPIQVSSIRSLAPAALVFNIPSLAHEGVNSHLPILTSQDHDP